jgi:hypothetical protein
MKIIAFTKHNPNLLFFDRPEEDSFKFKQDKNQVIFVVADGITRDPIGVRNFPKNPDNEITKKTMQKYPKPSPAKIAADLFCNSIIEKLKTPSIKSVEESIEYANRKIQLLNEENNSHQDYLENDFWACVGSCGIIAGDAIYWGYICDCGVCVFNKNGRLKFKTEDDGPNKLGRLIWKNALLEGKKWREAEARKIIRSHFRNNPQEKHSYGAFTGEKTAMHFVKTGKWLLESGDYVLFYSDGMTPIIYSKEFDISVCFNSVENYIESVAEQIDGSEGTLVAVKL